MENPYSVFIVDDEEEVRQAIINRLDWESIGFHVVDYAENGEEALEKVERLCPDVIMTDIQMPFMDGLTFCKRVREKMLHTKIVIFSGYDDFEYAKEAIKLEAEEYILKPINSLELKKVFLKIKERLDEEIDKKRNVERLQKYYEESLPVFKEQFFSALLEGSIDEKESSYYRELYEIEMNASYYAVGIIKPDYYMHQNKNESVLNSTLLPLSLKQTIDEMLKKSCSFRSINYLGNVVVIAMLNNYGELEALVNILDQVCKINSKLLRVDITAGIGKCYDSIHNIHYSFVEAKSAIDYRYSLGVNQAIYIQDIEPNTDSCFDIDEKTITQIIRSIKIGNDNDISEAVEHLIDTMKKSHISVKHFRNTFLELYVELLRLARIYEITVDDDAQNIYANMESFNSLDEVKDIFLKICIDLRNGIKKERKDATKELIERAKEYININFADCDLSVEKVCNYLGLSATYFSTVFKKETGYSFVSYLTQVRMEKALQLLQTTQEKAYIISEMVGYIEPNYFSYVFKKQYGVSPSKYRSSQVK